jgi:hypothetical protein
MDVTDEVKNAFPGVDVVRAMVTVARGVAKDEAAKLLIAWVKDDQNFGK